MVGLQGLLKLSTVLFAIGIFWILNYLSFTHGVTLTLGGKSIPTNGAEHILITDINNTSTKALLCQSELSHEEVGIGNWYLHPTQQSKENKDRIDGMNDRGWYRNRVISGNKQKVRLMRVSATAEEGVFTCDIARDTPTPVSVGIFYPIQSATGSIQVINGRQAEFRVQCNSTGGRALNMTVTGPDGFNSNWNNIQPVGDPQRIGDDEFSASTDVISGGRDGDIYQCTATNGVSSHPTGSAELRVASAPSIISLEQISTIAVRVEWSQPSEGATVTGYVVHYTDGDTDWTESVAASSNSSDITHLTSGLTYTISVDATSQHLSGESDEWNITLVSLLQAPEGVVVSDVQSTSVRVSWQAVDDADRYTVTLSQIMGDDQLGLCPEAIHSRSVNLSGLSVIVGQTEDILRAYTTYSITVVAESDVFGSSQHSVPVPFTTTQTNASVPPRNVTATVVNSTVISVQWDGLIPCSQVNGLIVEYRVQYTAESSAVVQSIDVSGEWNVMRAQTSLTGLTPYTNYSIQVAAVNEQGDVGLRSDPITTQTQEDIPGPVLFQSYPSLLTISIAWTPPALPNGVITAYEVSYRRTGSSQPVTRLNTTDLATNFTTPSSLEVGTEYIISVRAYTRVGPGNMTSTSISTFIRPPAVRGVKIVAVNATAANISWNALIMSDVTVDYYTVAYSRDGENNAVFPAPATSGVITNLNGAAVYQFRVFATVTVNGSYLEGDRSTPVNYMPEQPTASDDDSSNLSIIVGTIGAGVAVMVVSAIVVLLVYFFRKRAGKGSSKTRIEAMNFALTSMPYTETVNQYEPVYEMITDGNLSEEKASEPLIAVFPDDKQVLEGEEVVFRVKVTGVPVPECTWYHNGEEMVADYSKDLADDGSLTMPSAENKHSGVYQLVAVNRAGRVEKEVRLCVNQEGRPCLRESYEQIDFAPIPIEEYGSYVVKCHANDNKDFVDQFTEIDRGDDHSTTVIGSSPNLKQLNRFANITVYDDNRIILRPIEGHSDCQRDFINANYIDGYQVKNKFIATQGPLSKTTVDFWRLVWQERPQAIVMVTNLEECYQKKCHQYWPDTGTKSVGPFRVTITDQGILADFSTRCLLVKLLGSSEPALSVTQFHFTAWPDHGVPDYATSLLAFHKRLKKHYKASKGPMLVHCSAGVGRTGTLITIDCVLDQLEKERVVDIGGTIIHLRTQRMKMVQSPEQYIFIHDAILEAVTCGDTQINAGDLRKTVQEMSCRDLATHLTQFENQFKVLGNVSPNPREIVRKRALENPTRNRCDDYLPGDRWRVVLSDAQDYIHAVYVNGYKQQRAFIIAQSPMQSAIRDFWKMTYDRKCGVIIMLCDLVENGQEVCKQYWSSTGMVQIGEYNVDLLDEQKKEGFIIRKLSILPKKSGKAHRVIQLHMTNWSPDGHCSNLGSIIDVIAEMSKIQRGTGNMPVVVHCSDTVSRSGMFCAIATTIERCKTEGVVDVFQVVKALRVQKPGAVCNVSQFHGVFEAVLVFLDSFDSYDNFRDP